MQHVMEEIEEAERLAREREIEELRRKEMEAVSLEELVSNSRPSASTSGSGS